MALVYNVLWFLCLNAHYQKIMNPNVLGGLSCCVVQNSESTVTVVFISSSLNAEIIFWDNVDCRSEWVHEDGIQIAVLISLRWTFAGLGFSCVYAYINTLILGKYMNDWFSNISWRGAIGTQVAVSIHSL